MRGSEHRAKDIWSHPACRVGDKVVVLGKVGQSAHNLNQHKLVQARKEESVAAAAGGSSEASWNVIPQVPTGKD